MTSLDNKSRGEHSLSETFVIKNITGYLILPYCTGAVLDAGEDLQVVAALSKRSRTQVYSGRSLGLKGTVYL